jgi:hypothetical protein
MDKIGILYTSYGMPEYIDKSLEGWIQAKKEKSGGDEFIISAVSVQFAEYRGQPRDEVSPTLLANKLKSGEIDALTIAPEYISETSARNLSLQSLLYEGCTLIMIVDGDEFYSVEQIKKIFNFVNLDRFVSWFSISYKNYVFTEKQYLAEPFAPPRIFRVKTNGYELRELYHDNDFSFSGSIVQNGKIENKTISYKDLPSKVIPKTLVFVPHLTWLSNEKSRLKVKYQESRGWECSYQWNYDLNRLEFNQEYYRRHGKAIPEVLEEKNA